MGKLGLIMRGPFVGVPFEVQGGLGDENPMYCVSLILDVRGWHAYTHLIAVKYNFALSHPD